MSLCRPATRGVDLRPRLATINLDEAAMLLNQVFSTLSSLERVLSPQSPLKQQTDHLLDLRRCDCSTQHVRYDLTSRSLQTFVDAVC